MNIRKLSMKGLAYLKNAVIVWQIRERKLMYMWGKAEDVPGTEASRKRMVQLGIVLHDWIREGYKVYGEYEKALLEAKRQEEEMIVMLECPRFECRYGPDAVGVGVKYKNYEDGKHKCHTCGAELYLQDERQIQNMLNEIFYK